MEIFIRGLVALGIALAVATFAWSQSPVPPPPPGAPIAPPPAYYGPAAGPVQDNGSGWSPFMEYYFQRRDANIGGGHLGKTNRGVQFPIKRLFGGKGGFGKHFTGPVTQPGTVVFPQHPFARSPRDFFMID